MQIQKKFIKAGRRSFLRKSALAGGAVAVGSQVAVADSLEAEPSVAGPLEAKGYRATDHVQAYYKRARF